MALDQAQFVLTNYHRIVAQRQSALVGAWPLLTGYNVKIGVIGDHVAFIFSDTGISSGTHFEGLGRLNPGITGVTALSDTNKHNVRERLANVFQLRPRDGIVFVHQQPTPDGKASIKILNGELEALFS